MHWSGTALDLQALGRVTARVRLMGRPSGTLPVRMRHAQLVLALTTDASDWQQSAVGDDPLPPLLLLVMYPRHGVKLVISDAVHDVATPPPPLPCPDANGAASESSSSTAAAMASTLRRPMVICLEICVFSGREEKTGERGLIGCERMGCLVVNCMRCGYIVMIRIKARCSVVLVDQMFGCGSAATITNLTIMFFC